MISNHLLVFASDRERRGKLVQFWRPRLPACRDVCEFSASVAGDGSLSTTFKLLLDCDGKTCSDIYQRIQGLSGETPT